jgi:hypothetical protein
MDRVRRAVTMKSNSKPISGIGIRKAVTIQVTKPNEPSPLANKSGSSLNKNTPSSSKPKATEKETPSPNLTVPTILNDGYIDKEKLKDLLNKTFGKGQWKAKVPYSMDTPILVNVHSLF